MVQGFAAVLLVCLASVPRESCTEATALEVRSVVVDNEIGCAWGWQELVARAGGAAAARGDGPEEIYVKTACRRVAPAGPGERR